MKDLDTILKDIVYWRDVIDKSLKVDDPNILSKAVLKLALANGDLAEHMADIQRKATEKRLLAYKEARKDETQGDSEVTAKLKALNEIELSEKVDHIYKATDKLLSVTQSRLRRIETQMRTEGVQV